MAQHPALAAGGEGSARSAPDSALSTRTAIRVLDPDSASKIAAGEVIERPASVAKELIENAIDAGATDVRLEMRDGGISLLRAVDNGCGIPGEELGVAFERHATSKIASAEDLAAVATLGFRGEALPSIAAVAHVVLVSRPSGQSAGGRIELRGGELVGQGAAASPVGTTIAVRDLFFNTPARLKFLKTPLAEGGQITRAVGQFALAYPGIGFTLVSDGKTVFQSSGSGDLLDVITRLYGAEVAKAMVPVELCEGLQVRGYVSQPGLSRSSRSYLSLFVNGRWIHSRPLLHALEEAYSSLLMVGRHPVAVISVNLDPAQVDVNVHPSKAEVKFAAERQVFARVRQAVYNAVSRCATVPLVRVEPEPGWAGWGPEPQFPSLDSALNPGTQDSALATGAPHAATTHGAGYSALAALPMLRVLGQLAQSYIVAEGPGGLYLIDQHAAHERVRLDQLQRARMNDTGQVPDAQLLLQPLTIEVSPAQQAAAEAARPALSRLGFQLEPFGDRTYLLRSVPGQVAVADARGTITAILDEAGGEGTPEECEDRVLHSLACHSAVRAGQPLSDDEMRALVEQLERCHQPQACAHGRPTMVHLSQAQLEKEFGRR